jgi:hypothetical protein
MRICDRCPEKSVVETVIVEHVPKQCLDLGGEVQPASDVSKFSHLYLHDCSHIRRKIDC